MLKFFIPLPLVVLLPALMNAIDAIQASVKGLA